MAAFLKIDGIDGEATDKEHKGWIQIESMSSDISRTITAGARDVERMRGDTILGDISVSRMLDSSSIPLQECCAKGELKKEVTVHFCTQLGDKQHTYLEYVLKDVIVSGYMMSATANDKPSENVHLAYAAIDWKYTQLDPKTGKETGQHPGKFDPSKNATN